MTLSPHWHWAHWLFMTNISFHLPSWSCDKMLDYFHGPLYPAQATMRRIVGGSEREAEIIMFSKIRSRYHVLICDLSCFISKTFKQTWIMQTRVRLDSAPSKHNFYEEFLNFSKFSPDQFTENDFITTHIFRRNYLQENCLMSKRISALGFYILQTWINPGWVSYVPFFLHSPCFSFIIRDLSLLFHFYLLI